jgi:hypothetical protein
MTPEFRCGSLSTNRSRRQRVSFAPDRFRICPVRNGAKGHNAPPALLAPGPMQPVPMRPEPR